MTHSYMKDSTENATPPKSIKSDELMSDKYMCVFVCLCMCYLGMYLSIYRNVCIYVYVGANMSLCLHQQKCVSMF